MKPVPPITTSSTCPFRPLFGVIDVTVGEGLTTAKALLAPFSAPPTRTTLIVSEVPAPWNTIDWTRPVLKPLTTPPPAVSGALDVILMSTGPGNEETLL